MWSGRIANSEVTDTSYSCDLLVGYENQKRVEGIVPLVFDSAMNLDPSLPITVLGKIRNLLFVKKSYKNSKNAYHPFFFPIFVDNVSVKIRRIYGID